MDHSKTWVNGSYYLYKAHAMDSSTFPLVKDFTHLFRNACDL
jgi:hypothetical protein